MLAFDRVIMIWNCESKSQEQTFYLKSKEGADALFKRKNAMSQTDIKLTTTILASGVKNKFDHLIKLL